VAVLDFYFDFISPYAYLGWTQIHALAERHDREVRPIPALFAAMLKHSGTLGPAEIPAKRSYIFKDTLRTARAFGVPFSAPPSHPFNPLLALRVATVEPSRAVIDALYRAVWGGGGGVENEASVARALDEAGLPSASLLERANDPAIKQQLRDTTDRAIAAGVFGVPTVIADGGVVNVPGGLERELFWGVDSFPHLERFLAGGDCVTTDDADAFARLVPSANRPR
jgi:2-hydroxychromene-2-carboxylate isomerase